jgi:hypothetical protein
LVVFSAAGLANAASPTAAKSDSSVGGGNILFVAEADRERGSTGGVYEVLDRRRRPRGEANSRISVLVCVRCGLVTQRDCDRIGGTGRRRRDAHQ